MKCSLIIGIENSYIEPMTKYNFDRHEEWKKKNQMACICMGIDPGVVNVFAKYGGSGYSQVGSFTVSPIAD